MNNLMKNFVLCTCLLASVTVFGQGNSAVSASNAAAHDMAEPTIVGLSIISTSTSDNGQNSTQRSMMTCLNRMPRKILLDRSTELVLDYPAETKKSAKLTLNGFTAEIWGKTYECVGNKFSEDAIKAIGRLKSCDAISINDIHAADASGHEVSVKPCKIIIR